MYQGSAFHIILYRIGYLYVFFDKLVGVYKVRPSQQTCRFKLTSSCKYMSRQMVAQIWAFYHLAERLCVFEQLEVGGSCLIWGNMFQKYVIDVIICDWTMACYNIFDAISNVAKWMLLYAMHYPFKIGMTRHFSSVIHL